MCKKKRLISCGKELARKLKDLDGRQLRAFVKELSKRRELVEDISHMLHMVLRKNESSRDYRDFEPR